MKIKNIILISIIALVLMASLGCIGSNKDKIFLSENIEDVYDSLYSEKLTDLQLDHLWESKYENKYVRGTAYIKSVESRNILTENDVMGTITPSAYRTQIGVKFEDSELSKLIYYSEGDPIYFEGRLDSQGSMLLPKIIYVKDAVVLDSPVEAEMQQIQEPPSIPEPEETIDKYIFAFNLIQSDYIYDNLLSDTLKKQSSKTSVHNAIYALVSQGMTIVDDYSIIEINVSDETANMKIEFVWNLQGFRAPATKNINLTLENNEWKITDELLKM